MDKGEYGFEELDKEARNSAILDMLIHLRANLGPRRGLSNYI
jgi:hypothetical protein